MVADLRTPEGRADVERLAEASDVVIEGFEEETAERFGVNAKTLRARNSRLVHCSIKGFPSKSAYAGLKGYDGLVAAKVGLLQSRSPVSDRPHYSNYGEGTYGAAHFAVQGITAAPDHSRANQGAAKGSRRRSARASSRTT